MKYSIDTSAVLDGWRRYYPPDVFPSVWEKLDELIDTDLLSATEEVLIELSKKDDEVHEWVKARPHMIIPIDEDIQIEVAGLLKKHKTLIDTRKGRSSADPFVIALAKLNGATVITGETRSNSEKRPKIPDVCEAVGVPWCSLLQLFREQGWKI